MYLDPQNFIDIIVVVAGVLIALFINNFNDERKRKRRIKSILDIVRDNIKQDLQMIKNEYSILEKKFSTIEKIIRYKLKYEELSVDDKLLISTFLFTNPKHIIIRKEGYRLLKDADFNYNIDKNKVISDIISIYQLNITRLERDRDRIVSTAERNAINYVQEEWLHCDWLEYNVEKKEILPLPPSIENFIKKSLSSSHFINDVDYMGNVVSHYWDSLKDYENDLKRVLKLIS
jgi:hypothetical protein